MTRALAVIAILASTAHADRVLPGQIDPVSVGGELRGATAVFRARYRFDVDGPDHAMSATTLNLPNGAVATSAVVNGRHRLALVDAEQARAQFLAINEPTGETFGATRSAVLLEARAGQLDVSFAVPRDTTLTIDVEMEMPTCFYADARHVALPAAWKRALAAHLRTGQARRGVLDEACSRTIADDTQLWVAFPSRDLARRSAGPDRIGAHAGRLAIGDAQVAHLEIAIAGRLGEVPEDLATAIVVDSSRSMTPARIATQRAVVEAYARAVGDTRVQLVAYARSARALLPAWTPARGALLGRELRALVPRNGSNLDAGIAEAARWLAATTGTRRVLLLTDDKLSRQQRATIDGLAARLPAGTVVHVVAIDEHGLLERADNAGTGLATRTGGIAVRVGSPDERSADAIDATMLARPIRIDNLEITAPGWRPFAQTDAAACRDVLDEGRRCLWWGEGEAIAGPLALTGDIWGTRITRIVTPDARHEVDVARALLQLDVLDERGAELVERSARAATRRWSLYAAWGPAGGYNIGGLAIHGGSCCGGIAGRPGTATVRFGTVVRKTLPVFDLSPQLAHVIARCDLGEAHVSAELELTDSEIVGVRVLAPPSRARCVEDAIWDTALAVPSAHLYRIEPRVVLVH